MKEVNFFWDNFGIGGGGIDALFEILFGEETILLSKDIEWEVSRVFDVHGKILSWMSPLNHFPTIIRRQVAQRVVLSFSKIIQGDPEDHQEVKEEIMLLSLCTGSIWGGIYDVAKDLFIQTMKEFKMFITMDDDKYCFNFFVDHRRVPLDKNTKLKRERHMQDNTPGFTAYVSSFTESECTDPRTLPTEGGHWVVNLIFTLKYLFQIGKGNELLNLSGQVMYTAN